MNDRLTVDYGLRWDYFSPSREKFNRSAFFDPFGNAVHTALAFGLVGEDVLITGAGPIGLMAAAVARHAGARKIVVTDVSAPRLAMARAMGADLAYIGSAWIATEEANAVPGYKQAVVDAQAEGIVYTNLFTGVHGNYLRASILSAGLDPSSVSRTDSCGM